MKATNEIKRAFSDHFDSQLRSSMEGVAKDSFIKLSFSLPANQRFPYITKEYLCTEVQETLNKFYPLGARLAYIRPSPDDDHFIEVGALVKLTNF